MNNAMISVIRCSVFYVVLNRVFIEELVGAASVSVVVAGWVVAGIQNIIWLTVFV